MDNNKHMELYPTVRMENKKQMKLYYPGCITNNREM